MGVLEPYALAVAVPATVCRAVRKFVLPGYSGAQSCASLLQHVGEKPVRHEHPEGQPPSAEHGTAQCIRNDSTSGSVRRQSSFSGQYVTRITTPLVPSPQTSPRLIGLSGLHATNPTHHHLIVARARARNRRQRLRR